MHMYLCQWAGDSSIYLRSLNCSAIVIYDCTFPLGSVHVVLHKTHVTHSIYLRWKICAIDHHCNTHTHTNPCIAYISHVISSITELFSSLRSLCCSHWAVTQGKWTPDGKLTSKCWEICLIVFKIYDTVLLYQQHTQIYISAPLEVDLCSVDPYSTISIHFSCIIWWEKGEKER